jgi:hypothetical protein
MKPFGGKSLFFNNIKHISTMFIALSIFVLFGCSMKSGDVNYDTVVSFSKGSQLKFPDFVLEYMGERAEKKEFPNGNSFTFKYYDFKVTHPTGIKTVSWSSGTGVIDPIPFEFDGKTYEIEMRYSEKLKQKLSEDELVIVKK